MPETAADQGPGERSVVAAVRDAIVRGEFVPNQRLVEADLSAQFAASRASVRSALIELTNEGLVERVQNRGARVRAVSLEEAVEISEVRMMLESLCAAKAAERITDAEIAELRELGRRCAPPCRVVTSSATPGSTSGCTAGSARSAGSAPPRRSSNGCAGRASATSSGWPCAPALPQVSLPEHLAIIDAVCAHHPVEAAEAARVHLQSVIEALREADAAEVSHLH